MKLFLRGHAERYAVEQLQMSLFPDARTEYTETPFRNEDGAVSSLSYGKKWITATAKITANGRSGYAVKRLPAEQSSVRLRRRILQQSYYLAALQVLDAPPPWGGMAGVRPTKLATAHLLEGGTPESADRLLRDVFFVSPSRRKLCLEASSASVAARKLLEPGDISLYVGIPFCPSRCAYCSFVSSSTERSGSLIAPFFECLLKEVDFTGSLLQGSGHRIRTVYFGGGTPTILSAAQLDTLMTRIAERFDLSSVIEYTVEGGRPDTLTEEKLRVLRARGCSRISINPQTMSDRVLQAVGRKHTAADIVRCCEQAKAIGFDGINMDLIAGLPGDDPESFLSSLRSVIALDPANITVHTLALKKGADLYNSRGGLPTAAQVSDMLSGAEPLLRAAGYAPYYLYRQKYMSGSFENIGWCKPGYTGLYNIYMMEELQTILALGGGGMNKLCLPDGRLERFHNPKYPQEYISQIASVLEQKQQLIGRLKAADCSE